MTDKTLRECMRDVILERLDKYGWNLTHTASSLNISTKTLRYKLHLYGVRQSASNYVPKGVHK